MLFLIISFNLLKGCLQTPCPVCLPEKKVVIHHREKNSCPSQVPASKESFINYQKSKSDSFLSETICKTETVQEKEHVNVRNAKPTCSSVSKLQICEAQLKEPQQALKKSWLPFKLSTLFLFFLMKYLEL